MSRGKNFTAAEEHFLAKEEKLNKEIKALNTCVAEYMKLNKELKEKTEELLRIIDKLQEENAALRRGSTLTKRELEALVTFKDTLDLIKAMGGLRY